MGRLIDILVAAFLLVVAAPLFLLIAALIKLDSPGSVFFRQKRYGKGRTIFRMWKFRKMRDDLPKQGPSVTARFDARLTTVGRWLERTKLDELPQLINVLAGDMTLVGPRPEVPELTDPRYDDLWDEVFTVKPGLVGLNQILHRNESELYPENCEDRQQYYLDCILPEKLKVDAEYARGKCLAQDIGLFFTALWTTLSGTVTRESMVSRKQQIAYMALALTLGQVSVCLAYLLRFEGVPPPNALENLGAMLLLMPATRAFGFLVARVHRCLHSVFTLSDAVRVIYGVCLGTVLTVTATVLFGQRVHSRSIFLIDAILLSLTLCGANYLIDRLIFLRLNHRKLSELSFSPLDLLWTAAAGLAGALSIFAAISLYQIRWHGGLVSAAELGRMTFGVFMARAAVFGILVFRLRKIRGRTSQVFTLGMRPFVEMLVVAVIADLCAVFFLNARGFSRVAFAIHNLWFAPMLTFLLAARFALRARIPVDNVGKGARPSARRVLIVGDGREAALVVSALQNVRHKGFVCVGVVANRSRARSNSLGGVEIIGVSSDIEDILDLHRVDTVLAMKEGATRGTLARVIRACRTHGVEYRVIPDMLSFLDTFRIEPAPALIEAQDALEAAGATTME